MPTTSALEEFMWRQLADAGLHDGCAREHKFCQGRRWRFDFAWPGRLVALEVEGATWARGRHTRGSGFAADCAKYNAAAVLGWRVLRVTGDHVRDGSALDWVKKICNTTDL